MPTLTPVVISMKVFALVHTPVAPLQEVVLTDVQGERVQVFDGTGRLYIDLPAQPERRFRAGGSCGWQEVRILDAEGKAVQQARFRLKAHTFIKDGSGEFARLFHLCQLEVSRWETVLAWQGRVYRLFLGWLRDNTHVLKASRYFEPQVKDGIDLFRESQREDGMIWDFVVQGEHAEHFWESMYTPMRFFWRSPDGKTCFVRMPVENDVEYLFVEALYYAWQATGDDEWMKGHLDAAVRAMRYSVTDPLRYSQKFGLLKRAYTIDTWDFLSTYDTIDGIGLCISPDKTRFGVMFGDNTGYAMSCERLAEMLEHVGRREEAQPYRQQAQEIRQRLNAIAWKGTHFQHHVPEDPSFVRDFGVKEEEQVSLSNAYSLNRNISREQAVAILRTYQKLRDNLPDGSPGEWYMIYPPFPKGWERHAPLWEYMNGGVSPIVAGELAHGAFEHGFEPYGVDILRRVLRLAERTDGRIRFCYRGGGFEKPARTFQPLDISAHAHMSFTVPPAQGKQPWMNLDEEGNDLSALPSGEQVFEEVPFHLGDACVGLNRQKGHADVRIPVQRSFASLYLLHAVSNPPATGVCGTLTLVYDGGAEHTEYIHTPTNVLGWVFPQEPSQNTRIAWTGRNSKWTRIGITVSGFNNPHPDKTVTAIRLEAGHGSATWAVMGATTCDAPVYFVPNPISTGGPDAWAAAAVACALVEGLAGVKDIRTAFREVVLSPRWVAAGEGSASVCICYPASEGYVAYNYHHLPEEKKISLTLTGSGERVRVRLPLPSGAVAKAVRTDDDTPVPVTTVSVEGTPHVHFEIALPVSVTLRIEYEIVGEKDRL
ncbi:MAG: hypothetical protein RMM08_06925 [Armatimonadota bacterium]|nr:hypothetical protein [Armatimonadota bacterium]